MPYALLPELSKCQNMLGVSDDTIPIFLPSTIKVFRGKQCKEIEKGTEIATEIIRLVHFEQSIRGHP